MVAITIYIHIIEKVNLYQLPPPADHFDRVRGGLLLSAINNLALLHIHTTVTDK